MASAAKNKKPDRHGEQRERLVACAASVIATRGLSALRARDLAEQMGCAVGALYNLVDDLDDLVLLVASRTQKDLEACLDAATAKTGDDKDVLIAWAQAYLRFARDNRLSWRALFEFRLPPGKTVPAWFDTEQQALFSRLEDRLAALMPAADARFRTLKARILFAAVHGIVALHVEEKVGPMPARTLEHELDAFLSAYLDGLRDRAAS